MPHLFRILFPVLAVCLTILASPLALAQDTSHVRIDLIPSHTHPQAGEVLSVIIRQTIDPEWHTYWINPGDSGAAPTITWTLPEGFEAGDITWAIPERIPYAGLVNFGYSGTAEFLQDLYLPDPLPDGPVTLKARIEILVCRDICIPEFKDLSITLLDPAAEPVDNNDLMQGVFDSLPVRSDWNGTYYEDKGDLVVTIDSPTRFLWHDTPQDSFDLLLRDWGITRNTAEARVESFIDQRILVLRIARDSRPLNDVADLPILLSYHKADGNKAGVELVLKPHPEKSAAATPVSGDGPALSFGMALVFALAGGLILNLMPCVFPILSMKALSLVRLQDKDRRAAIASGLAYTGGILASFGALAGVLLGLKSGGETLGWGFHLQNPVMTLILAYLLFIIGLNLAGLFEFGGRFANVGAGLTEKKGWAGSFFTGVLATVVATPCTAPFMAGALGFALIQPAPAAIAVFLALGLGLALPYLAISCSPLLTRALPRPGAWMIRFREFLAFPMFASAAWLVWVLAQQAGVHAVMWTLCGMVAIALALWMTRHKPHRKGLRMLTGLAAALVLLFAALPVIDPHILRNPASSDTRIATGDYTPALYQDSLAGDDPVFVYMTAAWCITCKVNERVAIETDETHALFRRKNVRLIRGDWTTMNPDITVFLKNHGRSGVPIYVYHGPRDATTGKRPEPVILPQILTPAIIARTLG